MLDMLVKPGRIEQAGEASARHKGLASRFVAGLIGPPSMNFPCGTRIRYGTQRSKAAEVGGQGPLLAPADQGRLMVAQDTVFAVRTEGLREAGKLARFFMHLENAKRSPLQARFLDPEAHFFDPDTGGRF